MTGLESAILLEFERPVPEAAEAPLAALVAALLAEHGGAIAAILFYGSCRRTGDMTGLPDLTVLHDGHRAYHRRLAPALGNAVLPPAVSLLTAPHAGGMVRAKIAILSVRQFRRRMRAGSLDTTIWARFCQPASLLYAREAETRDILVSSVAQGIATACLWAVRLGPRCGDPANYWIGLFARTYAVELRPEPPGHAARLYDRNTAWFEAILPGALAALGIAANPDESGLLHPEIGRTMTRRWRWRAAWALRWGAGKALNVLRLAKAAFTFADGAGYVAWKVERHTGIRLELSAWQRRHPLLAAPALLLQLRRKRAALR